MKQEFKPLSWLVKNFDVNRQVIEDYDVLKYREDLIKKLKKKSATKEEFSEKLRSECFRVYWSRCEYELIIEKTEDGRIWLIPWAGCREPQQVKIDVTNREDYDWKGFADKYIDTRYGNKEKIDVYDQLCFVWDEFVDYVWNYHHKWQRRKVND
jgi:hypothetical protein